LPYGSDLGFPDLEPASMPLAVFAFVGVPWFGAPLRS
jgi:hypothetical protein